MALTQGSTALASDHNAVQAALRIILSRQSRTPTSHTVRAGDIMRVSHYNELAADYDTAARGFQAGNSSQCPSNYASHCRSNRANCGTNNAATCTLHAHCPSNYEHCGGNWASWCSGNWSSWCTDWTGYNRSHYGTHWTDHCGLHKLGGYT